MERKVPFEIGEYYHVYTRGVDKRVVFTDVADSERFLSLLLTGNDERGVKLSNLKRAERGFPSLIGRDRKPIVDVCTYALMPNHLHLILRETTPGGISKFMLKIMTGYSMYFNTRFNRSGPLFTRPFRSKHVDSDAYLQWLFAYTLLNPLDLQNTHGNSHRTALQEDDQRFLHQYRYSSFQDYFGSTRPEGEILNMQSLPFAQNVRGVDELLSMLAAYAPQETTSEELSTSALL